MTRIFATLAVLGTAALIAAYTLGWMIDDPTVPSPEVQRQVAWHFLSGVGGLVFAALVHAIVLTYFMGTGRWLEETSQAYRLPERFSEESRRLKHHTLPWMAVALVMLIITGAFGAIADPASPAGARGFAGISAATVHLLVASATLAVNIVINLVEYASLSRNSELVTEVLQEVHRIRRDKGLPVQ